MCRFEHCLCLMVACDGMVVADVHVCHCRVLKLWTHTQINHQLTDCEKSELTLSDMA